jgi:ATP-dependent Clp protease ATP-binding subunit ClpA
VTLNMHADRSVQLAWAIANAEANLAGDRLIQPVHMLLGLLKVIDAAFQGQLENVELSEAERSHMLNQVAQVRHYLEMTNGEITKMRRSIRRHIRDGGQSNSELHMLHRSDPTRAIFQLAAKTAQSRTQSSFSILDMAEVMHELGVLANGGIKEIARRPSTRDAGWCVTESSHTKADEQPKLTGILPAKMAHSPFVGRQHELRLGLQYLSRTQKRNIAIIGLPGCGKTALAQALAAEIAGLQSPDSLRGYEMLKVHGSDVSSDCNDEASVVRRINQIFDHLLQSKYQILFVDAFHGLFPQQLSADAIIASLVKHTEDPRTPQSIATYPEKWDQIVQDNASLARQFNVIKLDPMPSSAWKDIVNAWSRYISCHQHLLFSDEAVDAIHRYIESNASHAAVMVEKIVDVIEHVAAFVRVSALTNKSKPDHVSENDVIMALYEWRQ